MSCDHDLANEWARCSGKNASYITTCNIQEFMYGQRSTSFHVQAWIQGRWNGWIFNPLFLSPLLLFFSYPSNIEITFDFSDIITKIHPPFQNPGSALDAVSKCGLSEVSLQGQEIRKARRLAKPNCSFALIYFKCSMVSIHNDYY